MMIKSNEWLRTHPELLKRIESSGLPDFIIKELSAVFGKRASELGYLLEEVEVKIKYKPKEKNNETTENQDKPGDVQQVDG